MVARFKVWLFDRLRSRIAYVGCSSCSSLSGRCNGGDSSLRFTAMFALFHSLARGDSSLKANEADRKSVVTAWGGARDVEGQSFTSGLVVWNCMDLYGTVWNIPDDKLNSLVLPPSPVW